MDATDIGGIIIGAALVVYGVFRLVRRFYLKSRCVSQVAGTALKIHSTEESNPDSWGTHTFSIKFKYFVDGAEYVKKRMLSKRQYNAIGKHDYFTVFFDPSKPKRCYVSEIKFRMILTLSLIAIGAILLWVFL